MKKFVILLFVLLGSVNLYADDGISAGILTIEAGKSAKLDIYYTGQNTDYQFVGFFVKLPEGLSIAYDHSSTDRNIDIAASALEMGDVGDDHYVSGVYQTKNDRYKFTVESNKNKKFLKKQGLLCSITVDADESATKGQYDVKVWLNDMTSASGSNVTEGINKEEQAVAAAVGGFPLVIYSAGYATACSAKALDFSAVEGVEAVFTVSKVADNTATLSPIESKLVPAEAGVVVKGTSGTVFVPFAEGSVAELGPNELIGVTSATSIAEGCYILQGEEFVSCIAGTLPAGKAYLPATVGSSGAKAFTFDFGESTGINEVKAAKADGAIYSISGVRVTEPQKGVYIMNGRKVIVK